MSKFTRIKIIWIAIQIAIWIVIRIAIQKMHLYMFTRGTHCSILQLPYYCVHCSFIVHKSQFGYTCHTFIIFHYRWCLNFITNLQITNYQAILQIYNLNRIEIFTGVTWTSIYQKSITHLLNVNCIRYSLPIILNNSPTYIFN